jgi:glycosyltransferase involved in cell wall biosynthesis
VLFHPNEPHLEAMPAKLFEYMAAGIPVVASDFPIWQDIIGEHRCGLLVDPLDVTAIGSAVAWLLNHPEEAEAMGQRGRLAVVSRYNWETQAECLLKVYERLRPTKTPQPS